MSANNLHNVSILAMVLLSLFVVACGSGVNNAPATTAVIAENLDGASSTYPSTVNSTELENYATQMVPTLSIATNRVTETVEPTETPLSIRSTPSLAITQEPAHPFNLRSEMYGELYFAAGGGPGDEELCLEAMPEPSVSLPIIKDIDSRTAYFCIYGVGLTGRVELKLYGPDNEHVASGLFDIGEGSVRPVPPLPLQHWRPTHGIVSIDGIQILGVRPFFPLNFYPTGAWRVVARINGEEFSNTFIHEGEVDRRFPQLYAFPTDFNPFYHLSCLHGFRGTPIEPGDNVFIVGGNLSSNQTVPIALYYAGHPTFPSMMDPEPSMYKAHLVDSRFVQTDSFGDFQTNFQLRPSDAPGYYFVVAVNNPNATSVYDAGEVTCFTVVAPGESGKENGSSIANSQRRELGMSVGGKPIHVTQIGNGPHRVVVVGGLHGDEPASRELVESLITYFENNPDQVSVNATIYFIPALNPDALAANSRYNFNGVDLNRNWDTGSWIADSPEPGGIRPGSGGNAPFSEPETQALHTLLTSLLAHEETESVQLLIFHQHGGVAANGHVQPGYIEYGDPVPFSVALAQKAAAAGGYTYIESWQGSYIPTGELIQWSAENGIPAVDIELPPPGSPFTAVEGDTRTILQTAVDAVVAATEQQ